MRAKTLFVNSALAAATLLAGAPVAAATFVFAGTVDSCTPTCDSFAFLGTGSTIDGFIQLDDAAIADGEWNGGDVTDFSFTVGDPALPPFGPSDPPNPILDNPFTVDPTSEGGGLVVANGQEICNPRGCFMAPVVIVSAGTTDGTIIDSGLMDIWVTEGPLAANGAVIRLDFDAGTFTVNIFEGLVFVAGGTIAPVLVADSDGDGLADDADNCTLVANNGQPNTGPAQRDADADGIGSMCDADLNQTCSVDFVDLGQFKSVFFGDDENADFDDSGAVNFVDLGIIKEGFFLPPGPSGVPNLCSP